MRAPNLVRFRNLTLAFALLGAARGVGAVPTARGGFPVRS